MQPEAPETFVRITATLKAAIETAAAEDGKSANAWIVDVLEKAVTESQERNAAKIDTDEKQRKVQFDRQAKAMSDMIEKHRRGNS